MGKNGSTPKNSDPPKPSKETSANYDRYLKALHAMQTGVKFKADKSDQLPKHLRVGINVSLNDLGALAFLLVDKGVITAEEYSKAIADAMERKAYSYQQEIQKESKSKITLM